MLEIKYWRVFGDEDYKKRACVYNGCFEGDTLSNGD